MYDNDLDLEGKDSIEIYRQTWILHSSRRIYKIYRIILLCFFFFFFNKVRKKIFRNTRPRCIFFSRYTCVAYIAAAVDSIVPSPTAAEVRQDLKKEFLLDNRFLSFFFFFFRHDPFNAVHAIDAQDASCSNKSNKMFPLRVIFEIIYLSD